MKKPSRLLKIVAILLAIVIVSVFIDSWFLEPNRIKYLRGEIQIGAPTSEKFNKAKEFNIRLIESRPSDKEAILIALHGGAYGRYVCVIQHDGSHVMSSEFKKMNAR